MKEGKKEGSMLKMLPVLLAMVAVAAISVMYLSYMSDYDKREMADQLAREYILFMESSGCLTEEKSNELVQKLQNIGLTNINLAGTTVTKADYGVEIALIINARLVVKEYVFESMFDTEGREKVWEIKIEKRTTSKC